MAKPNAPSKYKTIDVVTGKELGQEISPELFYQKILAGNASPAQGDDFYFYYPQENGKIRKVSKNSPDLMALADGAIPLSEKLAKEREAFDFGESPLGTASSVALGALNAPTFGAADFILKESGLVEKETLKGIREANPNLTFAAELAADIGLGIATGGGSLAAKGAAKLAAKEALEAVAEKTAKEVTQSAVEKGVARKGLEALATPTKYLDEASSVFGKKASELAARIGAGKGTQKVTELAAQVSAQGAVYNALSGLSEDSLSDKELTAESLLSGFTQRALEGAVGGALFGGAAGATFGVARKTKGYLGDKIEKISEKIYPYSIGEEIAEAPAYAPTQSDLLFDQKETDFLNALGLKIPQVNKLAAPGDVDRAVKGLRSAASVIMGSVLHSDGMPLMISGNTKSQHVARIVKFNKEIGDDLKSIYRQAEKNNVFLPDSTDSLIDQAQRAIQPDDIAYSKRLAKRTKSILDEVLGPYKQRKMSKDQALKIENFIASEQAKSLYPNIPPPVFDLASKSILETISKEGSLGSGMAKLRLDALREFNSNRIDFLEKGSGSYKALTENVKAYIDDAFSKTNNLSAKDVSSIKKSLEDVGKQFSAKGEKSKEALAKKLGTFLNSKLEAAIVESVPSPDARKVLQSELSELKKKFAATNKFTRLASNRENMTSMHDRRGLIGTFLSGSSSNASTVGSIAGALAGGPVGSAVGAAAGYGLKKGSEYFYDLEKNVAPGVRAVRGFQKAGIMVADAETRGFYGKLEKVLKSFNSIFKTKEIKEPKKLKTTVPVRVFSRILGISKNDSQEKKERKVAEFSDAFRVYGATGGFSNKVLSEFDQTFGASSEIPTVRRELGIRASAVESQLRKVLPVGPGFQNSASSMGSYYTPLAGRKWRSNPIDTAKVMRVIDALENPDQELIRAASGDINIAALDTIQLAYPRMYNLSIELMLKSVSDREDPLTMQERSVLNILTDGTPFENSLANETSKMVQESIYGQLEASPQAISAASQNSTVRKPLTQNATKNIEKIKNSMSTFSDTVGTAS